MDESTSVVEVPISSAPVSTTSGGTIDTTTTSTSTSSEPNVPNTTTASTPTSSTQESNDGTQRNLDAERGKISTLERERNQLQKERDEALSTFEAINQIYAQSPAAYEAFRQDYKAKTNVDLGDHATRYGISQQPAQTGQQTNGQLNQYQQTPVVGQQGQVPQQPLLDPVQIAQQAAQQATQQVYQRMDIDTGIDKFLEIAPELSLKGLTDKEEIAKRQEVFEKVSTSAAFFKQRYPQQLPSWDAALKYAYEVLPERLEQRINNAQEDGQLIGRQQAYANGSAQTTGISGGVVQNRNVQTMQVKLNSIQQQKYNQFLAQDPKRAERYAQSVAKSLE